MNQKVLPSPNTLLTPMSPPMSSASRLQMVRPSPVPPYLRVVELSPWKNEEKSRSTTPGFMPMPVSWISTRTSVWSASTTSGRRRTSTEPS